MTDIANTWKLDTLYMAVTDDSLDYPKIRMGKLGVMDALYTTPHYTGTEAMYRDITAIIMSGYEDVLLPLIESGGYYTLLSDQGNEGNYYIVECAPVHKQALNKLAQIYQVTLQLRKESA